MKKRKLGDLEVSEIGMGCMALSHGYGQIPEEDYSIEAIRKAYDYGCTFFDTAEVYGDQLYYPGHNEQIVGKALKDVRDDVVIATKFHLEEDSYPSEEALEEVIRNKLAKSMENLQTDYVDLYYLHRVNPNVPVEMVARIMGKLIKEGKIKGWGLSQAGLETVKKAHETTPLSAVQNLYNMLERGVEKDLLGYLEEQGIGLVPFSPISSGLLSGKLKKGEDFSHPDDVRKFVPQLSAENMEKNQPIVDLVASVAEKKQATPAEIALVWLLNKGEHIVPIPGSKNQERILENLKASEVELSQEEMADLEKALSELTIYGHRGFQEYQGGSMADWGKDE